jgi:ABC-type multidrug transport system fused ATPase/permease subunit
MLREQYLSSIVVQDQAFFDRIGPGEIVTRASKDIDSVRTGLGERLGYLIWSFSSIVAVSTSTVISGPSTDLPGFCIGIRPRSQTCRGLVRPDPIHDGHVHCAWVLVRIRRSHQRSNGRKDFLIHRANSVVSQNRPVFRHGAKAASEAADRYVGSIEEIVDKDFCYEGT